MGKFDTLGRATFHHIASQGAVCPTNRALRWLKHIERHGPQSSVALHELTRDTHRCRDTSLRQIQQLRAGGYFYLPPQQRATERAECNPYIYDLTPMARRWLADYGLAEPAIRPSGHWWHAYQVACVTSAIDIAAARDGVRYIPAHGMLARTGARLPVQANGTTIIPDQLFALDYGGSFRAFVLEVDRGTEPLTSPQMRKSLAASIDAYAEAQQADRLRATYGLRAPVIILWVFNAKTRAEFVLDRLSRLPATIRATHLVQWGTPDLPIGAVRESYFSQSWARATLAPVFLGTV